MADEQNGRVPGNPYVAGWKKVAFAWDEGFREAVARGLSTDPELLTREVLPDEIDEDPVEMQGNRRALSSARPWEPCSDNVGIRAKEPAPGDILEVDGETWRVMGVGVTVGRRTYLHLASCTRGSNGRAGLIPVQQCGWFDGVELHDQTEEQP